MNTLRFVLLFLFAAWSGFLSANHTLENPYDSLAFVPSNQSGAKAYGILRGDLEKKALRNKRLSIFNLFVIFLKRRVIKCLCVPITRHWRIIIP